MTLNPAQFGQMRLFMTGQELKSAITDSCDRSPCGSLESMWKSKLRESKKEWGVHGSGTYDSLEEHGWQGEGPEMFHVRSFGTIPAFDHDNLRVNDAHHRIAAAAELERRGKRTIYIPTTNRYEYPSLKPREREAYEAQMEE